MDIFEIKYALEHITVIVDTREQNTDRLKARLKAIGFPFVREKLDYGDYSVKCTLEDGTEYSLKDRIAIERKMSMDELCQCYGKGRKRFEQEFARANELQAKIYLLIENSNWEKAYNGEYRSLLQPKALTASMLAWLARYNCQIIFCKEETTGYLIRDILYRELKEHLEHAEI